MARMSRELRQLEKNRKKYVQTSFLHIFVKSMNFINVCLFFLKILFANYDQMIQTIQVEIRPGKMLDHNGIRVELVGQVGTRFKILVQTHAFKNIRCQIISATFFNNLT